MKKNPNFKLKREKYLATLLHMAHVRRSGGTREDGPEDMQSLLQLGQSKTTESNKLPVDVVDLVQLRIHAQKRMPVFVMDFPTPKIGSGTDVSELSEEIWCAVPWHIFNDMYEAWLEKYVPGAIEPGKRGEA